MFLFLYFDILTVYEYPMVFQWYLFETPAYHWTFWNVLCDGVFELDMPEDDAYNLALVIAVMLFIAYRSASFAAFWKDAAVGASLFVCRKITSMKMTSLFNFYDFNK